MLTDESTPTELWSTGTRSALRRGHELGREVIDVSMPGDDTRDLIDTHHCRGGLGVRVQAVRRSLHNTGLLHEGVATAASSLETWGREGKTGRGPSDGDDVQSGAIRVEKTSGL